MFLRVQFQMFYINGPESNAINSSFHICVHTQDIQFECIENWKYTKQIAQLQIIFLIETTIIAIKDHFSLFNIGQVFNNNNNNNNNGCIRNNITRLRYMSLAYKS